MNTNARKQLQLLQDLRQALELQQFRLHYQPKFDAQACLPIGAEALLRWEHPQHGLLLPDRQVFLRDALHSRWLAGYFAVLTVIALANGNVSGAYIVSKAITAEQMVKHILFCISLLAMAFLTAWLPKSIMKSIGGRYEL